MNEFVLFAIVNTCKPQYLNTKTNSNANNVGPSVGKFLPLLLRFDQMKFATKAFLQSIEFPSKKKKKRQIREILEPRIGKTYSIKPLQGTVYSDKSTRFY